MVVNGYVYVKCTSVHLYIPFDSEDEVSRESCDFILLKIGCVVGFMFYFHHIVILLK